MSWWCTLPKAFAKSSQHTARDLLLSSFLNDGEELHEVLSAPRNTIDKGFLYGCVQVNV